MEKGLVVVSDLNGVLELCSVTKENCDTKFYDCCKKYCSKFEAYTSQDIDSVMEEGVFTTPHGQTIAIIWLDVDGNYNT